jgi:signal transduction histidine kinase/ActR/RegA family two-component response regulator
MNKQSTNSSPDLSINDDKTSKTAATTDEARNAMPTEKSFNRSSSSAMNSDDELSHVEYAARETRTVNMLRAAVIVLLLTTATLACAGVFMLAWDAECKEYEQEYEDNAIRIIESFHGAVERKLGAVNTLATQITSYALETNKSFPFVTLPHFAVRGADLRIQANSVIVHWMPLVTDETRLEWEKYAMENRFQVDLAYEEDRDFRSRQDDFYGILGKKSNGGDRRALGSTSSDPPRVSNVTILDDGTGYHPKIWSIGAVDPPGDYIEGTGPYLPSWQRSPISDAKQRLLNMNFAITRALDGALDIMLTTHEAVMNRVSFPIPAALAMFEANLAISQYRHNMETVLEDPFTFITYPVFDSFAKDRNFSGALATNIYWKLFFRNILQPSAMGIICVLENSFNQSFSYLLEGPEATYLGLGDLHNPELKQMEQFADVNTYVENIAGPETQSYTGVPLSREYGKYKLGVYPAYAQEHSNRPLLYTAVMGATFVFILVVFTLFTCAVEKRQKLVMNAAIENAQRAAATAHELNEFLSHEVRNPLSAAISACTFVDSALMETKFIANSDFKTSLQEDVKIILASLSFVTDFLRGMLDLHRAEGKRMEMKLAPTDLLIDILNPISNMFYHRDTDVEIIVDCPPNLVIITDCLRLKQVILNLGRNSSKFVEFGFIRFRVDVLNDKIEIYVEDSGPGIPVEKRSNLFQKFQASLDILNQGTGIGLCLCKGLVDLLGGEIFLDESYDSGIVGSPGARFVIRLNASNSFNLFESATASIRSRTDLSKLEESNENVPGSVEDIIILPDQMTVLFVDDDHVLRKLFVRAVRQVAPHWTIREAASGETAIQLVDSQDFDLIFMDQYMASTEKTLLGTETVRVLRSKGVQSILCGLSANDLEKAFVTAGADAFIMKPMPCEKNLLTRELLRITNGKDFVASGEITLHI